MKVRMINNETKTTDTNGEPTAIVQSNITIHVKTETGEDISRYNDFVAAIERAIEEATTVDTPDEPEENQ